MTRTGKLMILFGLTLTLVVLVAMLPSIPQDQTYHQFADQRLLFGIPNFMDVVSNFPMAIAAAAGVLFVMCRRRDEDCTFVERGQAIPYALFFAAVLLTSVTSAYYHLAPGDGRLAWDRMPLSLVFVFFLAAVVAERINTQAALVLLLPLAVLAINSVIYWNLTEARGVGDLRLYLAVQAAPILLVPAILALFPTVYTGTSDLAIVVLLYIVAKLCEHGDGLIYQVGNIVSGHTLKHCLTGVAVLWVLRMLRRREPL